MAGPYPAVGREGRSDIFIQNVQPFADGSADLDGFPFRVARKLADRQREHEKDHGERQESSRQEILYAKPLYAHS